MRNTRNQAENALVRKLTALVPLTAEEVAFLDALQVNRTNVRARRDFIAEGESFSSSFILLSGWALRYRILTDGRRQIISAILPGDSIGLSLNFQCKATYSVAAKTDCSLALVEPAGIQEVYQKYPVLASALSWAAAREHSILAENAVRLGRRTSYERLVHLLLELYYRLHSIGMVSGDEYELPLSQVDLSDFLGISAVHIHRTLQRLVSDGLVAVVNHTLTLKDIPRLKDLADCPEAFLEDFAVSQRF